MLYIQITLKKIVDTPNKKQSLCRLFFFFMSLLGLFIILNTFFRIGICEEDINRGRSF